MIACFTYNGEKLEGIRIYLSKEHLEQDLKSSELLQIHYSLHNIVVYDVGCSWATGEYPFPFGMSIDNDGTSLKEYLKGM